MERMGLLYQLSDSVFEEAVLESDEKAELSQAQFTAVLRNFGLGELLTNKAALDTLLLKGLTATSTPEKPVSVEPFMNWLTSEENSRSRASGRIFALFPMPACYSFASPYSFTRSGRKEGARV